MGGMASATAGAARGKSRGFGLWARDRWRAKRRRCGWKRRTLRRAHRSSLLRGLNRVLEDCGIRRYVEGLCSAFYAARMGRPSLRPGASGFEGVSSERGIAPSAVLRPGVDRVGAGHSVRTRRLIDVETHEAARHRYGEVLERLSELVVGKTVGIDATTLEANAAMRSIERTRRVRTVWRRRRGSIGRPVSEEQGEWSGALTRSRRCSTVGRTWLTRPSNGHGRHRLGDECIGDTATLPETLISGRTG